MWTLPREGDHPRGRDIGSKCRLTGVRRYFEGVDKHSHSRLCELRGPACVGEPPCCQVQHPACPR